MAECEEELKSLLMKVKEVSEKAGLKLNIHKSKITASGPITSWQIDGKNVETMSDFIFLGSKITIDSDWSHKIKRRFLLGRTAMSNLDSVLKKRYHFANKGPYSQSYGFSSSHVWIWELDHKEGWVPKKWCFELWCWRRLLRVPWTTRRSNLSIIKENQPWRFIERNDAEAPILWPPDANSSLGKDCCREILRARGEGNNRE